MSFWDVIKVLGTYQNQKVEFEVVTLSLTLRLPGHTLGILKLKPVKSSARTKAWKGRSKINL